MMRNNIKSRIETPWGMSQHVTIVADGIISVSTSGHGGYRLTEERYAEMPEALRRGWYTPGYYWFEEDCEWAKVALAFPDLFPAEAAEHAERSLRNWNHKEWEAFHGRTLAPGESHSKDEVTRYNRLKSTGEVQ